MLWVFNILRSKLCLCIRKVTFAAYHSALSVVGKVKKEGKDQALIQSSNTSDPEHHMGK